MNPGTVSVDPRNTRTGTRSRLPDCLEGLKGIAFSPDCRFMIALRLQDSSIVRYMTDETTLHSSAMIPVPEAMLCCVSYSGNLVVWRDMGSPQRSCYLHDFAKDVCTRLPGSEETGYPANVNLKFSLDETRVVGTMGNFTRPGRQFITIWDVCSEPIQQTRSGFVQSIIGLHLTNINETAFLASKDQWIELDLSQPELLSSQINRCNTDFYIDQKVSKRGDSLAVLSIARQEYVQRLFPCVFCLRTRTRLTPVIVYSPSHAQIELYNLAPGYTCRRIELQLYESQTFRFPKYQSIFSDDLKFLFLNGVVYGLAQVVNTTTPICLSMPEDDMESGSSDGVDFTIAGSHYLVEFSSCNDFVVCCHNGSTGSPKLEIYQVINSEPDKTNRMTFEDELDLSRITYAMTKWHHTKPILSLITWELESADSAEGVVEMTTCHTLDLGCLNPHWVRAEETYSEQITRM